MNGQEVLTLTNILLITGLSLILAELIAGIDAGFDLVLIGSILIISGLLNLVISNPAATIIFASILSVLYIAVGRRIVRKNLSIKTRTTNIDSVIGKRGKVLEQITGSKAGRIKVEDEEWRAKSDKKIEKGEKAEVVSIEGVTLNVEKVAK